MDKTPLPGLVMIYGPATISSGRISAGTIEPYELTCVCFYCGGLRKSERTCPACGGEPHKKAAQEAPGSRVPGRVAAVAAAALGDLSLAHPRALVPCST